MLCQHCQKRIANVHFTQVVNNKKVEAYICEHCAKEKGQLNFGTPLSISDFFSGLMGFGDTVSDSYVTAVPKQQVCEKCGMSYEGFQKSGKLGCNNCYGIYGDKLQPLLKRLHGSAEHHGKVPKKVLEDVKVTKEIGQLKQLLNIAIQNEEYEKAAELRDKIKSLEVER
ncbi:MAG: UvrB/UvrC motif-containing protein [Clostridia bacterium]|nr:UvrB/UvrC motif-containing protein [Clostridia bacterium]